MAPQSNSNNTNTTSTNITKPIAINTRTDRNNTDNPVSSDGGSSRNGNQISSSSSKSNNSSNSSSDSSSDEELSETITRLGAERPHPTQHSGLPRVKLRVSRPPGHSQATGSSQAEGGQSGDEGDWWEAERIIDERGTKYLVEWVGEDENGQPYAPTWEFKVNVTKELEDEWKKRPQAEKKQSRRKRKRANSEAINAKSAELGASAVANQVSRRPTKVARPVQVSKEDRLRARRRSTHASERGSSASEEESEYSPSQPLSQPQQIRRIIFTTPKPASPAASPSFDFSSVKRIKIKFKGQTTQNQEIEDSFELPSSHAQSSRESQGGGDSGPGQIQSSSDDSDDGRALETSDIDIDRGYRDWDVQSEPGSWDPKATPFQRIGPSLPRNTTVIPDSQGTFIASGDLSASTLEQSPLKYKHVPANHPVKRCSIAIEGTNIIRRRSEPEQEDHYIVLSDQDRETSQPLGINRVQVPLSSPEGRETEDLDVHITPVGLPGDPISSATAPPAQSQNALDLFDPIETQSSHNVVHKPTITSLHTLAEAAAAHNTKEVEGVDQENPFNNSRHRNSPEAYQLHRTLESQLIVQASEQTRPRSSEENRSPQDAQVVVIPPIIETQSTNSTDPSRSREVSHDQTAEEERASEPVENITTGTPNYMSTYENHLLEEKQEENSGEKSHREEARNIHRQTSQNANQATPRDSRHPPFSDLRDSAVRGSRETSVSENLEEVTLNEDQLPRQLQDGHEQQQLFSFNQPSFSDRNYPDNSLESPQHVHPEELAGDFRGGDRTNINNTSLPTSTNDNNDNNNNNNNNNNTNTSHRRQREKGSEIRGQSSSSSSSNSSNIPQAQEPPLHNHLVEPLISPLDISAYVNNPNIEYNLEGQSPLFEQRSPSPVSKVTDWFKKPDLPVHSSVSATSNSTPPPQLRPGNEPSPGSEDNQDIDMSDAIPNASAEAIAGYSPTSKLVSSKELFQKLYQERKAMREASDASQKTQSEAGSVSNLPGGVQVTETTKESSKQALSAQHLPATDFSEFDDSFLTGSQALLAIREPQRKLAVHEYCVPLSLTESQSAIYKQALINNYRTIEAFFGAVSSQQSSTQPQPSIEDIRKCVVQLEDALVHADLVDGREYPQYKNGNVDFGEWLVKSSTKLSLLFTILQKWRDEEKHVIVVAKEGNLTDLLEVFMHCWRFSFFRFKSPTGRRNLIQYDGKLKISIVPSRQIDSDVSIDLADLVIALDGTFDSSEKHIALARGRDGHTPVLWLVVVNSSEHIALFTNSSWDEQFHLNAVLFAALLLRDKVGHLSAEATASNEKLKDIQIVDWLKTSASNQLPSLPLTDSNQNDAVLQSNDETGVAAIQESAEESAALNSRKRQLERTNSFEQVQNIVVSPKRPRMDIDGDDGDGVSSIPKELEMEPAAPAPEELPKNVDTSEAMDIGNNDSMVDEDDTRSQEASRVNNAESDKEMAEVDDLEKLTYQELLQLYHKEQQESKQFVIDAARLQSRFEEREEQNRSLRKELLVANKKIAELDTVRLRQSDKISNLQSEIRVLKDERDSKDKLLKNEPEEFQRLSKLEPELRNAQAQIEVLNTKVERQKTDYEYIRGEYQKASSKAAENGRENNELGERLKDAQRKADDVKIKLLEMSYTNELAQKSTEITHLRATILEREEHIRRIDIENKRAEKSRPLMTRASSVPRQRASPTPSVSRASSPAPHASTMPLPFNLNPNSGRETSHPLQQVRSSGI